MHSDTELLLVLKNIPLLVDVIVSLNFKLGLYFQFIIVSDIWQKEKVHK